MKKLIAFILFCCVMSFSFAQNQYQRTLKTPEQRVPSISNYLAKVLTLSDDQKTKVYNLALDGATKMKDAREENAEDRQAMRSAMKQIRDEFDAQMKNILTPDQFASWQKMKEDRKQERLNNSGTPPKHDS